MVSDERASAALDAGPNFEQHRPVMVDLKATASNTRLHLEPT
jgi:hypothetical protein